MQDDAIGGISLDMYDFDFRQYMPELGRFTSIDPLAEKYSSQSPYLYAYNNPIRFSDYLGLEGEDEVKDPKQEKMERLEAAGSHAAKAIKSGKKAFEKTNVKIEGSLYSLGGKISAGKLVQAKGEIGVVKVEAKANTKGVALEAKVGYAEGEVKVGSGNNSASAKGEVGIAQGNIGVSYNMDVNTGGEVAYTEGKVTVGDQTSASINQDGEVGFGVKVSVVKASIVVNVKELANWYIETINTLGTLGVFDALKPQIPNTSEIKTTSN